MVTSLSNLRSTNSGGQRKVFVTVANDAQAGQTSLDFLIAGANHTKDVPLGVNETTEVEMPHQKTGSGFVVVTASGSQAATSKFLDLDAPNSF